MLSKLVSLREREKEKQARSDGRVYVVAMRVEENDPMRLEDCG